MLHLNIVFLISALYKNVSVVEVEDNKMFRELEEDNNESRNEEDTKLL